MAEDIKFRHTMPVQIRFSDVDQFGHMNNSVYFSLYDLAKTTYKRCIRQCRLEQAGYCGSQYQCKLLYAGIFLGSSGDRNGCGTFGA